MTQKHWYEYRRMKKRHEILLEELRKIAPTDALLRELFRYAESMAMCSYFYSVPNNVIFDSWNDFVKGAAK